MEARDTLWSHPDLLPSSADLDDPAGFVDRDKQFTELLAGFDELDTSGLDEPRAEGRSDSDDPGGPDAAGDRPRPV